MATDVLYLNDVGHVFTIQTGVDLSSINTLTLEVLKPLEASTLTWVASASVPGSGTVIYVTKSGDLNTVGIWEAQVFAWKSNVSYFHGDTFNFEVRSFWT